MSEILPGYATEDKFAELLREKTGKGSKQTLGRWRRLGIGPKWIKAGRTVLYKVDQEFDMKTASTR
jgi:hypothetical protein